MNLPRALALMSLTGLSLAGAVPAPVTIHGPKVTVQARPGGRILLTVPARPDQTVQAEQVGQAVLVTISQQRPAHLTLIALNTAGRRLWKQEVAANLNRTITHSGQFLVEYVTSGAQLNIHTLIWNGRAETTQEIPGRLLARNKDALLFNTENELNPYEAAQLTFTRFTPATATRTGLTYRVPARPRCGDPQLDVTDGDPLRLTGRYVYALRQDRCGPFVARFDWTGANDAALVYPRPRP